MPSNSGNNMEVAHLGSSATLPVAAGLSAGLDVWSAGGLGAPTASESSKRHISVDLLWRYRWTMLLSFFLLAIPGVLGVWFVVKPQYRAVAVVEVSPVIPRLVFQTENSGVIPLYSQYLNTQEEIIGSPSVLTRVLEQPDVQATHWFREPPTPLLGGTPTALERLMEDLSVEVERGTQVINVRFAALDAADAATIVNAVVKQYSKYVSESVKKTDDLVYRELLKEYESRRAIVETLERDRANRVKELNTADPELLLSEQRQRLDKLIEERSTLQREMALVEWKLASLDPEPESDAAQAAQPTPVQSPAYELDPEWQRLFNELERKRHRVALAEQRLGERNPQLIEMRSEVDLLTRLLQERTAVLKRRPALVQPAPGATTALMTGAELQDRFDELKYQDHLLNADITKHQAELTRTADLIARHVKLNEELKQARDLFEVVRTRKTQREVESGAPGAISIQAEAFLPSQPFNQKRRYALMAMVVFGSAAAALALAYVRASTSQAIHNADDVVAPVEGPFLGYLPLVRDPQQMEPREQVVRQECVRMVRTALLQRLDQVRGNVVMVTSAGPGAGKTEATLSLADSLAQVGKRVLLVDADVRSPSLSTRCNVTGHGGLLDLLKRTANEEDVVVRRKDDGLQLLPAGDEYHPHDSELLASDEMVTLLERWRERFDIVILDSAPVMPVADARILASLVDGTVMIVREEHCRRAEVREALNTLTAGDGKLLGMMFLGSVRQRHYYDSYYRNEARVAPEASDARRSG